MGGIDLEEVPPIKTGNHIDIKQIATMNYFCA
jgi:hypothetical protein